MTMYRLPELLLVANPIDRYSIGSATPGLVMGEDGSLTLYISARSPGQEREANWLPAPDGPLWMAMRLYWPKEAAIDGSWKAPKLEKVK